MTTEHPAQPPEGHLDGEAASAVLDGETTDAETTHLAGCDRCQAVVEELRALQAAVAGRPPPVPAAVREASITAALQAFDEGSLGGPADEGAIVATLRARPRFVAGPWLGVAAVLLLLVVAVPLIARSGNGDGGETTATDRAAEGSTALAAPDEGFTDVGDLGELDAGADLRSVVDQALSERAASPSPAGATAEDEGDAVRDAPAPETADDGDDAVSGGGAGTGSERELQAAAGRPSREAAEACLEPVRAELGELGALVLAGTGRVDGEPALVLGFAAVDAERPTVIVVLVVAETCRLVTFQSYARD
ncbi:MAG: hypothetical protein WD232_05925 [Acidimicrobiales bacterium]